MALIVKTISIIMWYLVSGKTCLGVAAVSTPERQSGHINEESTCKCLLVPDTHKHTPFYRSVVIGSFTLGDSSFTNEDHELMT